MSALLLFTMYPGNAEDLLYAKVEAIAYINNAIAKNIVTRWYLVFY